MNRTLITRPGVWTRRRLIQSAALGVSALMTPGVFAEMLTQTPRMTRGPFFPDKLPLDTDNDLLRITDRVTPAVGEITHLAGRILDAGGNPVRNALVEVWQVDGNGVYLHSRSAGKERRDDNFQGYGRFLTSSTGAYYFRTVKPVAYPGRTPHIHVQVSRGEQRLLATQMMIKGEPQNERDFLYRQIRDEQRRAALLADFKPIEDSPINELQASWDVVLGWTPPDPPAEEDASSS